MTTRLGFLWSARIAVGTWLVLIKSVAYWAVGKELR